MPSDILRRFEEGELVGDPNYNEVYLRALLKSYAQAVSISPQETIRAFDAQREGAYNGELRRKYLEAGSQQERAEPPPAAPSKPKADARPGQAPAVAALAEDAPARPTEPASGGRPADPNEHFPKRRVKTDAQAAISKPIERSWTLLIGGAVAGVLVIGLVLWLLFRDTGPEPELPDEDAVVAEAAPETDEPAADPAPDPDLPPAPTFQTPIQLTIVAADEPLEEFRVQVDDEARRPYWIEPGAQQTFTGRNAVAVWGELSRGESGGGQYDGARLRLQGLEWTPRDGQVVRIDAQRGQALLDSLHRAQSAAPAG